MPPVNDGLTPSQRAEMANDLDMDPLRNVGSVTSDEDSDGSKHTYQHKTIARYRLGRFEFKEHLLAIRSAKDNDEFLELLSKQPYQERMGIVELNQAALQALENDPLRGRRVMTGLTDSAKMDDRFRPQQRNSAHGAQVTSHPGLEEGNQLRSDVTEENRQTAESADNKLTGLNQVDGSADNTGGAQTTTQQKPAAGGLQGLISKS